MGDSESRQHIATNNAGRGKAEFAHSLRGVLGGALPGPTLAQPRAPRLEPGSAGAARAGLQGLPASWDRTFAPVGACICQAAPTETWPGEEHGCGYPVSNACGLAATDSCQRRCAAASSLASCVELADLTFSNGQVCGGCPPDFQTTRFERVRRPGAGVHHPVSPSSSGRPTHSSAVTLQVRLPFPACRCVHA